MPQAGCLLGEKINSFLVNVAELAHVIHAEVFFLRLIAGVGFVLVPPSESAYNVMV